MGDNYWYTKKYFQDWINYKATVANLPRKKRLHYGKNEKRVYKIIK